MIRDSDKIFDDDTAQHARGTRPEVSAMLGVFALYWRIEACIEDSVDMPELSRMECHILVRLGTPSRMGELARMLQTVPSSVTAAADRLERQGLIRRSRDPQDRRAWLLSLTPDGLIKRDRLVAAMSELFQRISGLDRDEIQQFAAFSAKIHDTVVAADANPLRKE
ncbi:MarR family transcriptional regulator [Phaeobacter sp. LSS9]|uniref:MarR family winged helix-turn-helix transcriptional regulator n=1 Tax=unclassified Phaeobacter TaxID=2621772 RepID=UPI000E4C88A8|nr:MarR family transcriptional regulator [Phaeobacter sp. LSS9]AXT36721.1 MarR family transcriptional regulator [Phaeobacter sp. LSS9]